MVDTKLHCFTGKMAAGKSTLARELARTHQAILLVEDAFLAALFPGEIHEISDYITYSARIKEALTGPIVSMLGAGAPVVLDFPGNTPGQRAWFRELFERARVDHELHFLDLPDHVCKRGLQERSRDLPPGSPFTTEAEFDAITQYFQVPRPEEGFNITVHTRG